MKHVPMVHLLITTMSILYGSVQSDALPTAPPGVGTSLSAIPLQLSVKLGMSALFYTPEVNRSTPLSITGSIRLFELIEPSATLLIAGSTTRPRSSVLEDRVLAGAFEIRMSPTFWNWYQPSIGIGWFHTEWWPNETGDRNQGIFCSLSLISAAPHRLAFPIRRSDGQTFIQPYVNAGDIRFGPIVPWGKRWSENSGNYYFEVTLFNLGVTLW